MSDQNNNSIQQKIRKFSKFLTTKVKEKTAYKSQNETTEDDEDELFQDALIVRRHSSYIHQTAKEPNTMSAASAANTLKQDLYFHYHTLPPTTPPTTSALSPPPRQIKSKTVRADDDKTNLITKPCLSRSNTLGHHTPNRNTPIHHSSFSTTTMSSSSSSFIITSPPSSTSLSSLASRCNVNHTLIN